MLVERGPVLVEVNCRVHGGEGTWAPMAEAALGYSAVSALLDCAVDPAAFAALPAVPTNFAVHVMEAKLRSPVQGILKKINTDRWEAITKLRSYSSSCVMVSEGKPIVKTIDACSASGNVNLIHANLEALREDYKTFHQLVEDGLFEV
jgi:biotin carboxylase